MSKNLNEENILLLMICEERLISIVENAVREVVAQLWEIRISQDR